MKRLIISLLFIILIHGKTYALEIYSFIDNKKQVSSGFVLGVGDTDLSLLSLEGKLNVIKKETVTALYIYNIVQNPIKTLKLDASIAEYLRDVYITDKETPSFTGFPVQMIDEIVIFFDLTGKIHVHLLSDIVKLRKYNFKKDKNIPLSYYKKTVLIIDNQEKPRGRRARAELAVYPTKIYKGKININKYFKTTRSNFVKIYSYQERTFLYAKPMIFDQDFKLGNTFLFRKLKFQDRNLMNIYIQWATGSPYGFQSKTTVGNSYSQWLPILLPTGIIQSEIKSHFFNTLFVGNLNLTALPAGNRYYTSEGDNWSYSNNLKNSYDPFVEINFNYMLLLGGDYGPWSASLGMFYPIYAVNIRNHIREITATKTSPAFRFIYLKGKVKIKSVFSITMYDEKNGETKKSVFARFGGEMPLIAYTSDGPVYQDSYGYSEYENDEKSPLIKYTLDSYTFRLGFIYSITHTMKIGFDALLVSGEYRELFSAGDFVAGNNSSYPEYKNSVKYRNYNAGFYLHHRFSDYVALKVILNYFYNTCEYDFFNISDKDILKKYEYGGAFELIF